MANRPALNKTMAVAAVFVIALLALAGGFATVAFAERPEIPDAPLTTPPPPQSVPSRPDTPRTLAEDDALRAQIDAESNGKRVAASGPETAGTLISVGGKEIRLPADVWVQDYVVEIFCPAGQTCARTPAYELRRGDSSILVDADGVFWSEKIEAHPGDQFAFLVEGLK